MADASLRGGVVVTGASSGIGRACALHLASLGFPVFAGVRREEDGRALEDAGDGRVTAVRVDVTDDDQIAAATEDVARQVGTRGLAGLVNNAGIVAGAGPLEFASLDEVRRQLEVNVVGQLAVTQAFLPLLRQPTPRGRVVFVGSIGGRMALPFLGPYGASKHAIAGLSESLRRELRPLGVRVSLVEPGAVATPIWEKGAADAEAVAAALPDEARRLYGERLERMRALAEETGAAGIPAEEVAAVVEHALTADRPRARYLVGSDARLRGTLVRLAPDALVDRLLERRIDRGS